MGAESKREVVPAEELLAEAGFLGRLARELVRGAERAEDLVQDTFVAALEHPPRERGAVRGWLAVVARNLARNARRGERRRDAREAAVARPERVEAEALALERLELQQGLFELLLALPVEARTVLYLRYYEGLGPSAIATRLGVPLKTVKSRHTRALALLRERLDARTRGDRRAWVVALSPLARSWPAAPGEGGLVSVLGGLAMKKLIGAAAAVVFLVLSWFAYERFAQGARAHLRSERDTPLVTAAPPMAAVLPPDPVGQREVASAATLHEASPGPVAGRAEVTLLWSDGTPAAGIGASMVRLSPRGAPMQRVRALSDAEGILRFEELAVGTNRLAVQLRATFELEIEPGATRRTTVTLPAATQVRGVVRTTEGAPVANAALVFEAGSDWNGWAPELEIVARTASDGGFTLRDVEDGRRLGARAVGRLPSPLVRLLDLPVDGGARWIEFRLEPGEGRLAGRVLAPDGTPLAGARVLAGPRNGHHLLGGGDAIAPRPLAAESDTTGRFELEDALPTGPQPVHCAARGFGQWDGVVTITGGTAELEIRLEPPARVEGRVVDVHGEPVAGVRVLQSVEHLGGWYLEEDFPAPFDVSDAAGAFVLEWVAPGTRELNAFQLERPGIGRARAAVECKAGETTRCELRLELGHTISGRVVDEHGRPLAGWNVGSRHSDVLAQWYPRSTSTDADGRFRLVNLGEGAHDLDVRAPSFAAARLQVKAVATGKELELVVPDADVADGELVGRLIDPQGSALDDIRITLWRVGQNEGLFLELDPTTGMFRGRDFPGEYRLRMTRAGADLVAGEVFTLESGQVTDLGDLLLAARGRLELHVVGFPVEALASLHLRLVREGLRELELEVAADTLRSPELLAGRWKVQTHEAELVLSPDEFEVLPGGVTRADLTATPRRR